MPDLYTKLKNHFPNGFEVSRRKGAEYHIKCPNCGKEEKRGQVHFSFSVNGGHCFVCGWDVYLWKLAEMAFGDNMPIVVDPPKRRARPPKRAPFWLARSGAIVQRYVAHGEAAARWASYKPISEATRLAYRLGFGVLPQRSSRCVAPRLIVPILMGDQVAGLRARAVNAAGCRSYRDGTCAQVKDGACAKWLPASGSAIALYNGARLLLPDARGSARGLKLCDTVGDVSARGRTIFIVENPVDALLVEALTGALAVATLAVSYWFEEWTRALAFSGAEAIVVAYDNDVPGNGNTQEAWALWRATGHRDIEPGGVRLVNRLLKSGLPAMLWDWSGYPAKADIGGMLALEVSNA